MAAKAHTVVVWNLIFVGVSIIAPLYVAYILGTPPFTDFICVVFKFLNKILFPYLEDTQLAAISAVGTSRTHCHLCPTRYSFRPQSIEA